MTKPKGTNRNESVPVSGVVPIERMMGDDSEDTALLGQMLEDARDYLRSFSWRESIKSAYFGGGIGGILAIFLFHISPARAEVASWIWIVVGDIPPAYLPLDDCESSLEVQYLYRRDDQVDQIGEKRANWCRRRRRASGKSPGNTSSGGRLEKPTANLDGNRKTDVRVAH